MKTRIGFLFLLVAIFLLQAPLWARSGATLLATTDLDCTWKLDGTPQGSLQAEDSKVVPISRGKHLVQATSADGQRKYKTVITITRSEQEMVEIKLKEPQPPEAKQSVVQQPATQPQPETIQQPAAQPKVAHQQPVVVTEPEHPTWTDPATGLMWAGKDNGSNLTWKQAGIYCSDLRLEGHSDWRLATINELSGIYDKAHVVNGWHVKGGIRVTGWEWSGETPRGSGEARYFTFHDTKHSALLVFYKREALCVRRAQK